MVGISTVAWVLVGVGAWCLVAVVVAVVVGRVIAARDRQRPARPPIEMPGQRSGEHWATGTDPASRAARLTSRLTRRR